MDRGQHERNGFGNEPGTAAGAVDRGVAERARGLDPCAYLGVHARRIVELTAGCHDIDPRRQQPAHFVEVARTRHVQHTIRSGVHDLLDAPGGGDAGSGQPAQFACIAADLVVCVDVHTGQGQRRVFDHRPECTGADVSCRPLHDPIRPGGKSRFDSVLGQGIYTHVTPLIGRRATTERASRVDAEEGFLRIGRDEAPVLGENIATAEAAAVRQQWTVLAKEEPPVGAERPMEPEAVRGDGRGECRAVTELTEPVKWAQRRADKVQVGGVRSERLGQLTSDFRCAHPEFEIGVAAAVAFRSAAARVSHGRRSRCTRNSSGRTAGTAGVL